MRKILTGILAGVLTLAMTTVAFAAVTFNTETSTGFVGKGDVQTALGLNNAQMQQAIKDNSITFTLVTVQTYEYDEVWETNRKSHSVDRVTTTTLNSSVDFNARKANQYNGFNITGSEEINTTGEIPVQGATIVDPQTKKPYPTNHTVDNVVEGTAITTLYVNGVALQ